MLKIHWEKNSKKIYFIHNQLKTENEVKIGIDTIKQIMLLKENKMNVDTKLKKGMRLTVTVKNDSTTINIIRSSNSIDEKPKTEYEYKGLPKKFWILLTSVFFSLGFLWIYVSKVNYFSRAEVTTWHSLIVLILFSMITITSIFAIKLYSEKNI